MEFDYADADRLPAELAEFYAYSEAEQIFAGNGRAWTEFAQRKQVQIRWLL